MLRLPKFELQKPTSLAEALRMIEAAGENAMLIAGGTDLVPNMKHELFTPEFVIALAGIKELHGIAVAKDGALEIGAMTALDEVANSELVNEHAPALAQAASVVAGPQLRRMGTMGGNVMLDTRCQWYNQTYFWREALGFCLKKDGSLCHVVQGGKKCVAAASNDSAPALMTLGAELHFESPRGANVLPIDELWKTDGIFNKQTASDEILCRVRIPKQGLVHKGAYGKLRPRGSIDFAQLGIAVRLDLNANGKIEFADAVAVALQARPLRIASVKDELIGQSLHTPEFEAALKRSCEAAYKKLRPLDNIPGDKDYRREMVPVLLRRTVRAAADGSGPVLP